MLNMAFQKPIELIHARNLMGSLSTPAVLVDEDAQLVYYNDAAGQMLGRRFEETGPRPAAEWGAEFGPVGEDGDQIDVEKLGTTVALRRGRPAHGRFTLRSHTGESHHIESSAVPLEGGDGFRGAMVFFWPVREDGGGS
jgi:PAS domain-containing protein